jgi:hypothetical protein
MEFQSIELTETREASAILDAEAIIGLLESCRPHLSADRLTTGAGGNALDCFR